MAPADQHPVPRPYPKASTPAKPIARSRIWLLTIEKIPN